MILRAGAGRHAAIVALAVTACGAPGAPSRTHAVVDAGASPKVAPALRCNATATPLPTQERPFPIASWHVAAAAVAGDELLLLRYVEERGGEHRETSLVERRPLADAKTVRGRVLLDAKSHAFAVTKDGRTLVLHEGKEIVLRARESGVVEDRFPAELASEAGLVPLGQGDKLAVLAAVGPVATLFDRRGTVLDRFPIEGRTPTIIRRYGVDPDHPTVHENVLRESSSWVTALAATDDARRIAIGGSDGKVRLVDRRTKQTRVLDHKWTMNDRRAMGANPDLNRPLAMRFSDDGARLVVALGKGEILTWSADSGALLGTVPGQCTPDEASRVANRFTAKDEPRQAPTADDAQRCARADHAAFARDGSWIAMDGDFVRVRALPSGAPIAMIADEPDTAGPDKLVTTTNGELLMGDIYGSMRRWSRGGDATSLLPKEPMTSPGRLVLAGGGRLLTWDGRPVETSLPLDGRRHRVLSPDGRKGASFGRDQPLQIWDVATAQAVDGPAGEVSAAAFFADGTLAATYVEGKGAASLRVLDARGAATKTIPLDGVVTGLAVAPDDGEVTVVLSRQVVRFAPGTFEKKADPPIDSTGTLAVSYTTAGPTLLFESFGLVDIRRRSDLSRVAQIAAVAPNDWVVVNEVGAVEGSAGAAAATIVSSGRGFADGREAFDRARAPNVLACALTGVSVGP